MAPVDSLPADQQAVLKLLLRQGRSYAQIAGMLKISDAAVRERAHGALTALGPPADDLSARRRAEIGDWLLGQADAGERADAEALLDRNERARAWAGAVADELAPLGGDRVPELPASGPADPAAEPRTAPAAAPAPAPAAAAPAPASATRVHAAAAPAARPHSSRVGGAVLLALLALLAVVAVVLLTRGDDDGGAERAASTTSTQGDAAQSRVVAQVNLRAPDGAPAEKALGVVQVVRAGDQQAMSLVLEGIPQIKSRRVGYGVWLSSPSGKRQWLGYPSFEAQQGRLVAQAALSADVTGYRDLLVTRERGEDPPRPGTIYLRGRVQRAPAQGSG
jgi:sigma-70-like protein